MHASSNNTQHSSSVDHFQMLHTIIEEGIKNQKEEITLGIPAKAGISDEKIQELIRFYGKFKGIIHLQLEKESGISNLNERAIIADIARHNKQAMERKEKLKQKGINNSAAPKRILFTINNSPQLQAQTQTATENSLQTSMSELKQDIEQRQKDSQKKFEQLQKNWQQIQDSFEEMKDRLDVLEESREMRMLKENANYRDDKIAQFELAKLYENGIGIKKDEKKALALFKRSSELKYGRAQNKMGEIFEQGLFGVEKSASKALKHYLEIQYNDEGDRYEKGIVNCARLWYALIIIKKEVMTNIEEAIKEKSEEEKREHGSENSFDPENYRIELEKSIIIYNTLLTKSIFKHLEPIAKKGNSEAQYYFALCNEGVENTIINNNTAVVENLEKSAKSQFYLAQFKLGLAYEAGLYGLEKNVDKASNLFEKAAKVGHAGSQCMLRYMASKNMTVEFKKPAEEKTSKEQDVNTLIQKARDNDKYAQFELANYTPPEVKPQNEQLGVVQQKLKHNS